MPAHTGTVLFAGGTGGSLADWVDDDMFGTEGTFLGGSHHDDEFVVLDYPNSMWPITGPFDPTFGTSVEAGTDAVTAAVRSTPGPLIVAGVSQGAVVVQHAMAVLNDDPSVSSDITFVLIADPNMGLFKGSYGSRLPVMDYVPRAETETRFATVVVVHEYDGWADPIANPGNALTVANAIMAMAYVHPYAQNVDLASVPASNITVTTNSVGGTTTRYLVPADELPLTSPLRDLGVPGEIVDEIDGALRPLIDAGYVRDTRVQPTGETPRQRVRASRSTTTPPPAAATASARKPGSSSPRAATGTSVPRSPAR